MTDRATLDLHLNQLLEPARFKDYGPNGLQVEGRARVNHLVCGVTASLALIDAAIERRADAMLVHHGLFWRGQDGRVTGWMKKRLERLLKHDINLFAYHLPLDAHPQLGNNAQFGLRLGWRAFAQFGEQNLGCIAETEPTALEILGMQVQAALGRVPVVVPGDDRPVRQVAWCTGGAQGYFEAAIAAGADAFVTGEISEPQAHYARETGVAFIAAGHHATELYGVQAVGSRVAQDLGLSLEFIDIHNPA